MWPILRRQIGSVGSEGQGPGLDRRHDGGHRVNRAGENDRLRDLPRHEGPTRHSAQLMRTVMRTAHVLAMVVTTVVAMTAEVAQAPSPAARPASPPAAA